MRDALAERLLAQVMNWSAADIARERPILQALALLKYDEYQQFSPGMRFVESLAFWLAQFASDERTIAYDFIRARLVFFSEAEMAHFAHVMYPDLIRPLLLERAARTEGRSPFRVGAVSNSDAFVKLQAATLFFGLSDGARVDQFRRSNRELSHEQIFASYELPSERVGELRAWLAKQGLSEAPAPVVVLLDDFAGSGASYIRREDGGLKGKLFKFLQRVTSHEEWNGLVDFDKTEVLVALYVASAQAVAHITDGFNLLREAFGVRLQLQPVQLLDDRVRITPTSSEQFVTLIERYYDPTLEDEHTSKGGTDLKYGFASCGLPLVLHHNTPNNSLFLLWVEDSAAVRPLFQRFSRHRREA